MAHVVFFNEDIRGRNFWFFFVFNLDLNGRAPPRALPALRSSFLLDRVPVSWSSLDLCRPLSSHLRGTHGEIPRHPKIRARAPLWWSGISNNVGDPQTHTAPDCRLTEGVPRYRVVSYLGSHLVYPSAWLVLLFGKRRRLDLTWSLYRPGLGGAPEWICFTRGRFSWAQSTKSRAMHGLPLW